MLYDALVYGSLTVFGLGLIYKTAGWFCFSIGGGAPAPTVPARIRAARKGIGAVLFSSKLAILLRVFVTDVLLQLRIFRKDKLRWAMHMLIFTGFLFLLFTHALDKVIVTSLFDDYYVSLNPFLIGAGLMVLAGLAIAAYRRFIGKVPRLKTNAPDSGALILLAVIILSGLAMEMGKLTSYDHYQKFWYVHILSCFLGLAWLPFSKMLHVFTTPASLLTNSVMDEHSAAVNIITRQAMELDACTHCCTCSLYCSVAVACDRIGNDYILPSERMVFLKDYITGKHLSDRGLAAIQQGIYLCTNCDRCTVSCPAGIDLRNLWFRVREEMIRRGQAVPLMLTPFSFYRGLRQRELRPEEYLLPLRRTQEALGGGELLRQPDTVIPLTAAGREFKQSTALSARAETYAYCFTCENCSTVCPVAGNYDDPGPHLDLLPHQIIRSLALSLPELALGSRMLWYCLTCYQCQEHCPQGVKVTDIFYELKNLAVIKTGPATGQAASGKGAVE